MVKQAIVVAGITILPLVLGGLAMVNPSGDWGEKMVFQLAVGLVTSAGFATSRLEDRKLLAVFAFCCCLPPLPMMFLFSMM